MKHMIVILLAVLSAASVVQAQSVPSSVDAQIKQAARAKYPDDYEMQEYKIKEQRQAYLNVQSYSAADLPQNVFAGIRRDAVRKYPRDYEMQEYKVKEQVKAYRAIQSYTASGIPADVFRRIRQSAMAKYPTDYEMQEYKIDEQVKAYRRTHAAAPRPSTSHRTRESHVSPPQRRSASAAVPSDVMKRIKARHAAEFPDNFSMQKIMVDADAKAYRELQSYADPDVPREVLDRIIRKHAQEFPDNYSMQKIMVDADVKAYKELH